MNCHICKGPLGKDFENVDFLVGSEDSPEIVKRSVCKSCCGAMDESQEETVVDLNS